MDTTATTDKFEEWAIVELMGHVRIAGKLTEEERFGAKLGRIDIPLAGGLDGFTTQYFSGGSVYRITPCEESIARRVAEREQPAPISRWELRGMLPAPAGDDAGGSGDDE